MDKEVVVYIYNGILYIYICTFSHKIYIYSAVKMNEIGSFVVMWLDLETVIQSQVSPKEKSKYCILMYIYGT